MNPKKVKLLFLACILLGSAFFVAFRQPAQTKAAPTAIPDVVKIGALIPLTGGLGAYGPDMRDGALLAEHVVNNIWGGITRSGTSNATIDVLIEDTATDPTTTAAAAEDLIETDAVEVMIGAAGSSNTLAAAGKCNPAEVVLISYASTSPALSQEGGAYFFRTVGHDGLQGWALADVALAKGYRKAASIYLDNAYGIGMADVFYAYFVGGGGEIVDELAYVETATSFDTELSRLKSLEDDDKIDCIMDTSYADDGAIIFTEAATKGITTPWVLAEGAADAAIFGKATGVGTAMLGMIGTKPFTDLNSPEYQFFNDTWFAQYPTKTSVGIYADYAYDAVMMAVAAIQHAGDYSGPAIKTSLMTISQGYDGVTGDKTFDANGDVGQAYNVFEVTEPTSGTFEFTVQGSWNFITGASYAIGGTTFTHHNTVTAERPEEEEDSPGFELIVLLAALSSCAAIVLRRRRR
ncbi:MAG: ABC transporter substrate-binding protein [Candidatus Hodarchaeota archaeon]